MANTVDQSFITQFGAEVKQAYQRSTKLKEAVRNRTGVIGSTAEFHTLDALDITTATFTKARGADVPQADNVHAKKVATLGDYWQGQYINKLDALKTNVDLRREYVSRIANSFGRLVDNVIITECLDPSATVYAGAEAGTAMSVAYLRGLKRALDKNDVDMEGRFIAMGPDSLYKLLSEEKATSSDYAAIKALVSGEINTFMGFNIITMTGLAGAGGLTAKCFAWQKDSAGLAIGQDVQIETDHVFQKGEDMIRACMSMGGVNIEDGGIIEFIADES